MANPPQPVCNIAAPTMRAIEATHRLSPTQLAGCAASTALASTVVSLLRLQGLRMRMLMPFGTLLWLVHNLLVGSLGGRVLEACLLVANLWTIRGLWRAS